MQITFGIARRVRCGADCTRAAASEVYQAAMRRDNTCMPTARRSINARSKSKWPSCAEGPSFGCVSIYFT